MEDADAAVGDTEGGRRELPWTQHAPQPVARVVRAVLALGAAAALVYVTIAGPGADPDWAAFGLLTTLGVAARFLSRRSTSVSVPGALAFVGGAALVLSPALAAWTAAIVGLAGLARGDRPSRIVDSFSTLVLSTAAASLARSVGPDLAPDQRIIADGPDGLGVLTALLVGVALTASWQLLRWIVAWLDRRASSATWQVQKEMRWLRDLTFAAAAVLLGAMWLLHPVLILLVLIPLLSVWRFAEGTAIGGLAGGTDPLTDTARSGMLRIALAEEVARSQRFDRPLSILVADVDRMSTINQRYGHEAGDRVMREVTQRIRTLARDYDLVARIGGDSFALMLPECDREGARTVAERACELVASQPVDVTTAEEALTVTISVGTATFPGDAQHREQLLTEAELAASYARLEGGDRCAEARRLPTGFRGAAAAGRGRDTVMSRMVTADDVAVVGAEADRATVGVGEPLSPDEGDELVRAVSEPLSGARSRTDRLLTVVGVLALGLVVWRATVEGGVDDAGRLALFTVVAVGAEWFAESIYGRANASWAAVPLVALATLDATPLALTVAAVATAFGGGLLRGLRGRQTLYNSATLTLATLAGAAVAVPTLDAVGGPQLLAHVVGGLVGGAAFFVVDTWLVTAAIGLATGSGVFDVWREDLLWLVPHQLGMGLLGGVMAFAHLTLDVTGTVVLVLPALGLHFAQRQFVSRTRDHVMRLRNLNDDLQHANARVVKVNERLTDALEQVNNGYLVTVESLAAAVDAKDSYTGSHIDRVEVFGRMLLEVMDPELTDDEALLWGFRLHDVGKIGVPDSVLLKPGPLDDDEWEMMKRHPEIGAQIVQAAPFLQGARDVILHHHERWDGRGYPFGLRESAIPFSARVFSCIDAFDAMTSDRPYRDAMPIDRAMQELLRHAGTQFDPEVIEAFLQIDGDDLTRAREQVETRRGARRAHAGGGLLIPIASEGYQQAAQA